MTLDTKQKHEELKSQLQLTYSYHFYFTLYISGEWITGPSE